MQVDAGEKERSDDEPDRGARPREDQLRLVRDEDGDEPLHRHADEDPSLELAERVHEEHMQLAAEVGDEADVGTVQPQQPLAQEAGVEDDRVDECEDGQVERRRALAETFPHHHGCRERVADRTQDEQDGRAAHPQRLGDTLVRQLLSALARCRPVSHRVVVVVIIIVVRVVWRVQHGAV